MSWEKAILNFLIGGPQSPLEIADFFEVDLEYVTEILKRLEERGLVKRKGEKLELTERGKRYLERNVWELHVHAPW